MPLVKRAISSRTGDMHRGKSSQAHKNAYTDRNAAERANRVFGRIICIGLVCGFLTPPAGAEVLSVDATGVPHRLCAIGTAVQKMHTFHIPATYRRAMMRAAARFSISTDLLDTVARTESNYDPAAVSPKGAIGIMQLMPGTAKILGVDPHDPDDNIQGGAAYLRYLLDTFNGRIDYALGAYNAGQNAIIRYGALPPYPETRAYVAHSLARLAHLSDAGHTIPAQTTCR